MSKESMKSSTEVRVDSKFMRSQSIIKCHHLKVRVQVVVVNTEVIKVIKHKHNHLYKYIHKLLLVIIITHQAYHTLL